MRRAWFGSLLIVALVLSGCGLTGPRSFPPFVPPVVVLPPVVEVPPGPSAPIPLARIEDRLAFAASFATHNDDAGAPVFDPFWSGLDPARRSAWLANKRGRGLKHIVLVRAWAYGRYEAATGFSAGRLEPEVFNARIVEAHAGGLWPLVWLPFDDDAAGEAAVYDGRMEAEARALLPVADKIAGVVPAWETPGAWSAKAIADAGALLRRVFGPDMCLILHGRDNERFTGASYRGEGLERETPAGLVWKDYRDSDRPGMGAYVEASDPSGGDEIGWWFVPGADQYDAFFWESRHGPDGPTYSDGSPDPSSNTWLGRFVEGWERFAPGDTYMPALGRYVRERKAPDYRAPDWFGGVRARGRPILVPFELQQFEDVLDVVPDSRIDDVADLLASFGVTRFGSGVPRARR